MIRVKIPTAEGLRSTDIRRDMVDVKVPFLSIEFFIHGTHWGSPILAGLGSCLHLLGRELGFFFVCVCVFFAVHICILFCKKCKPGQN